MAADSSVLSLHRAESSDAQSQLPTLPLQCLLDRRARDGVGTAGFSSQQHWELEPVVNQLSGWIPTIWLGSFQSLTWLCYVSRQQALGHCRLILGHRRAKISALLWLRREVWPKKLWPHFPFQFIFLPKSNQKTRHVSRARNSAFIRAWLAVGSNLYWTTIVKQFL